MHDERLPERAAQMGAVLEERMRGWASEYSLIGDVRVLGAMAALELVTDRLARTPAAAETAQVLVEARERGLILLRAGVQHNVIRTLMPLTIPDDQLEAGLDILEAALAEVSGKE
jgi:4-aminobutyrate aminotransferase/(S)-3-amino-2-methylpropionate transaminase